MFETLLMTKKNQIDEEIFDNFLLLKFQHHKFYKKSHHIKVEQLHKISVQYHKKNSQNEDFFIMKAGNSVEGKRETLRSHKNQIFSP